MGDKTDLVGLGAIALVGYFLIKKVTDLGNSVSNTATNYIKETVVKESVGYVTDYNNQLNDNPVLKYVGVDVQRKEDMTTEQKTALENYKAGNVTTETVAASDSLYTKLFGSGEKTTTTSSSGNKYTSSAGSLKVDNVVQVNPTKQTFETSAFTLEMPNYMAAAGSSKSTGSSSTQAPTTVKASAGGYSVARESGTTVNAGKYEPIKASSGGSSSTQAPTTVKASSGGYSVAKESGTTVNKGKYEPIKVKR